MTLQRIWQVVCIFLSNYLKSKLSFMSSNDTREGNWLYPVDVADDWVISFDLANEKCRNSSDSNVMENPLNQASIKLGTYQNNMGALYNEHWWGNFVWMPSHVFFIRNQFIRNLHVKGRINFKELVLLKTKSLRNFQLRMLLWLQTIEH